MSEFRINVLGVRGSKPICNHRFLKYGGNTFCIHVDIQGLPLVFDAGTGVDKLQMDGKANELSVFFTHYHIDHFAGIYYLKHLYNSNMTIKFYGFSRLGDLNHEMKSIFSPIFFPLGLEDFPAELEMHTLEFGDTVIPREGIEIRTFALAHPGGCMAYSLTYKGKKICICTDTAPLKGRKLEEFCAFADNSDYLFFDSYFLPNEVIPEWGHSSYKDALDILRRSRIHHIMLTHYAELNDERLDELQEEVGKLDSRLLLCKEGMSIEL